MTYNLERLKEDLPRANFKELLDIRKVMRDERLNYPFGEYSPAVMLVVFRLKELMFK